MWTYRGELGMRRALPEIRNTLKDWSDDTESLECVAVCRLYYLNHDYSMCEGLFDVWNWDIGGTVFVKSFLLANQCAIRICVSRDSVIGIVTSYGLDDRGVGVLVLVGSSIFSRPFSAGVKRPGREVNHSPPTSAEVKKMWIYTSTFIRLHGVVLN
jgi:hypothetical protein